MVNWPSCGDVITTCKVRQCTLDYHPSKFSCDCPRGAEDINRSLLLTIHKYRNNVRMRMCLLVPFALKNVLSKGRQKDLGDFNVSISIKSKRQQESLKKFSYIQSNSCTFNITIWPHGELKLSKYNIFKREFQ